MFGDTNDSDILEMPRIAKSSTKAKEIASANRRERVGMRAGAPKSMSPAQAALRIDEELLVLLKQIASCSLHSSLLDESAGNPNHASRVIASRVAQDLYLAYRMKPTRIAASVEGGIMLAYQEHVNLDLEIEIDNEGDVTGVISSPQGVLRAESITLPVEFNRLVRAYRLPGTLNVQRSR